MRTLAPGRGFTLLELLLVVAIIAVGSAGVTLAFRDAGQTQLAREADRLASLFESARARSLASGVPVRWRVTGSGFRFEGLPPAALPDHWLSADVSAPEGSSVVLGPEPIIGPQSVRLLLVGGQPGKGGASLTVHTDGVRPFAVLAEAPPP